MHLLYVAMFVPCPTATTIRIAVVGSGPARITQVAACNSRVQYSGYKKLTLLHGDFVTSYQIVTRLCYTVTVTVTVTRTCYMGVTLACYTVTVYHTRRGHRSDDVTSSCRQKGLLVCAGGDPWDVLRRGISTNVPRITS